MKKRMMQVADFTFDVCATEENDINDFVQAFFDKVAGTGTLKFCYKVTPDGYSYQIDRYMPYGYRGDFVIDHDCMLLTGFPVEEFRVNPLSALVSWHPRSSYRWLLYRDSPSGSPLQEDG